MIKKLTFSITAIIFISLTLIVSYSQGGEPEVNVRTSAYERLRQLSCAQIKYQNSHSGQFYPDCPGRVCWNSSSIVGSTADLENVFEISLTVPNGGNGGDVRFRCRSQNGTLYCFAFRCTDLEPAGCDQKYWRLQVIPKSNCTLGTECSPPQKCTPINGSPVCSDVSGGVETPYTCL